MIFGASDFGCLAEQTPAVRSQSVAPWTARTVAGATATHWWRETVGHLRKEFTMAARKPAKPAVAVEPRPKGWAVQTDGTKRAASLHATKAEAVDAGRAQAKRQGAELVIKGKDGRIQTKDSHGNDPRSSKG